jgi:hypothetical protein
MPRPSNFEEKSDKYSQQTKIIMPRLETCCCFTARTGALIIAIMGVIGCGFGILTASIINFGHDTNLHIGDQFIDSSPFLISQILSNIITVIICGLMLYGVTNDKYLMIMPWLIFVMIGLVTSTILIIIGFILLCLVYHAVGYGFILAIISAPLLVLAVYFWIVVQSVYCDIKENDQPSTLA